MRTQIEKKNAEDRLEKKEQRASGLEKTDRLAFYFFVLYLTFYIFVLQYF